MMELRCLILKIKNDIYTVEIRDNKCEVIKDRGEVRGEYTNNYWSWWIDKLGYSNEEVDILTLFDDELKIDDSINNISEATWNSQDVMKAIGELERESGSTFKFIDFDEENSLIEVLIDRDKVVLGINKKFVYEVREVGPHKKKKVEAVEEKIITEPAPKGSLKDYYLRKTKECIES